MSSYRSYAAIRSLLDSWAATPIAYENEPFVPPEPPAPYIAPEITGRLFSQASLGAGSLAGAAANWWREEGALWVHVLVPSGTSSGQARQIADQAVALFRGVSLAVPGGGVIRFRDAHIGAGAIGDDMGNWWRISVSIDWQRDE